LPPEIARQTATVQVRTPVSPSVQVRPTSPDTHLVAFEQDPNIADRDPARIGALPEDLRAAIGRLMPFATQAPDDPAHAIPYDLQDYLELVDWSGRAIIEGKRGKIPDDLPPILARLKIDPDHYVRFINRTQKSRFHGFFGSVESMRSLAGDFGRSFLKGQAAAAALFSSG